MKIVILENKPSTSLGGQELSLFDVAKGLSERGHEIIFLYATEGNLLSRYQEFCSKVIKIKGGYSIPSKNMPLAALKFIQDLFLVPKSSPMIVYANQYLDSLFAASLAKIRHCPFVCHLRLPPPDLFCGQHRIGISHINRLIAVSEQTRRDYIKRGFDPNLISVVHNGIDASRFGLCASRKEFLKTINISADAFVVTYAGRLHPAKGLQVLFEAFSQLRARYANAVLVIVGQPADLGELGYTIRNFRAELEESARILGIEQHVVWIDHSDDIPNLFGASDVVALPSLWPEPFGRILIEAMACGVPAVGSRAGGIPEILTGEFDKFMFRPGIAEELTGVLLKLVDWRKNDPDLSKRCRSHVEKNFSITKTVDGVERVLALTLEEYQKGIRNHAVIGKLN